MARETTGKMMNTPSNAVGRKLSVVLVLITWVGTRIEENRMRIALTRIQGIRSIGLRTGMATVAMKESMGTNSMKRKSMTTMLRSSVVCLARTRPSPKAKVTNRAQIAPSFSTVRTHG